MDVPTVEVATYNLHTKKNNLIHALRVATRRVVDRAALESLEETQPEVRTLCTVLENVANFRLKLQIGWFGADEKLSFWQFLCASLRKSAQYLARIKAVEAIETLRHDFAKERAFFRIALMDKSLVDIIIFITTQQKERIRAYYSDGSFFSEGTRSNRVFIDAARRLANLDFSFDVRLQSSLNAPFAIEIDYAALCSDSAPRQTTTDIATAATERDREASPTVADEIVVLNDMQESFSSNTSQASKTTSEFHSGENRFSKLEARLKTVVEQNAYLEDVVRDQRKQIEQLLATRSEIDKNVAALRTAHAAELRTYEQTILELQVQLTLIREQHDREIARLRDAYETQTSYAEVGGRFPAVELRTIRTSNSNGSVAASRNTASQVPTISNREGSAASNSSPRVLAPDKVPYVESQRVPPSELVIPSPQAFTVTDEAVTPMAAAPNSNAKERSRPSSSGVNDNGSVKRSGTGANTPSSVASTSSFEVVNGVAASASASASASVANASLHPSVA